MLRARFLALKIQAQLQGWPATTVARRMSQREGSMTFGSAQRVEESLKWLRLYRVVL